MQTQTMLSHSKKNSIWYSNGSPQSSTGSAASKEHFAASKEAIQESGFSIGSWIDCWRLGVSRQAFKMFGHDDKRPCEWLCLFVGCTSTFVVYS